MLWLAVAFPDLGLAVHTRAQPPEVNARPLALVRDGRVLAGNAVAMAAGIQPGQRTAGAMALCPVLRFLEQLPEEEARLIKRLADSCIAVTPTVVLSPPHTLLLEIEGCLQLFRGLAGVLRQLRRGLRQIEMTYTLALAPTPKAALALVPSAQADASLALPLPITHQTCRELLAPVPVAVLPWPEPLQRKLAALHLASLGELLALPRAALSKRLGTDCTRYLAQLLGELPDPQTPIIVAEDFQETLFFLDGISQVDGLRFPMKRLLEDFCRFLRQRQWSCARFQWRFAHQDKSRQSLIIASSRGEPQAARFMQLTELKLEHVRISAPVEAITLIATEFHPQSDTRLSLLPDPGQEDTKALELLDRLRARLGAEACQCLHVVDTHRPEAAQHLTTTAATAQPPTQPDSTPRPFWLWPEPKPVRVMEGQLWWQGALTLLSRPERISLPWWEASDTRDYYLARHDNGAHYWVFFSWEQHRWFCHGLFG
ncbi:MAG: DNA polymerase Y family protein [Moraxellaceae bacterium]|nr:DNA polymerase Y family protein [Moraxellaceae bacterium]